MKKLLATGAVAGFILLGAGVAPASASGGTELEGVTVKTAVKVYAGVPLGSCDDDGLSLSVKILLSAGLDGDDDHDGGHHY